jgi:hypothetical protein
MIISNITTVNGLGVDELKPDPVTFFPNPVFGSVTIRLSHSDSRDGMVRVVDLLGVVKREAHCSGREISLDLASLRSGLYFIQFHSLTESYAKPLMKY